MKKRNITAIFLMIVCLLAGCAKPPAQPVAATAEVTTAPPETSQDIMYDGAIRNFLTPKRHFSWEREYAPEFVMLHFTSAVMIDRENPYQLDKIRRTFVHAGVSVHYIVERDGTVRCYVPENAVAWHAGEGTWMGDEKYTNKLNLYAIGIEILAIGSQNDMAPYLTPEEYAALDPALIGYTDEQYASLKKLVADICSRYEIPMTREYVLGHQDYSPAKTDPGELFDWSRVLPDAEEMSG